MRETTALGAAIAAGFAVDVWKEFDELKEINQKDRMVFKPNVDKEVGEKMFKKWGRVSNFHEPTARVTGADFDSPIRQSRCVAAG
jgi:glycerol kinase